MKRQRMGKLLLGVDGPGVDHLGTVLDQALDLAGSAEVLKGVSQGTKDLMEITLMAVRAREPRIFIRSETMEGVMTL